MKKITPMAWHLLFYSILFFSLILIPIFNLYSLFPNLGIEFYLMPKLDKFLATYTLEQIEKYNLILWYSYFLWFFLVFSNFFIGQYLNKIQNKKYLRRKTKKYYKIFLFASLLPMYFSLKFLCGDLKFIFSSANNMDYVQGMLLEEYVFRQCILFFMYQAGCSILFLILTVDEIPIELSGGE